MGYSKGTPFNSDVYPNNRTKKNVICFVQAALCITWAQCCKTFKYCKIMRAAAHLYRTLSPDCIVKSTSNLMVLSSPSSQNPYQAPIGPDGSGGFFLTPIICRQNQVPRVQVKPLGCDTPLHSSYRKPRPTIKSCCPPKTAKKFKKRTKICWHLLGTSKSSNELSLHLRYACPFTFE